MVLQELLKSNVTSRLYKKSMSTLFEVSENSTLDDNILWDRQWVYCDQTDPSLPCQGSIAKADWIDPQTRPQKCLDKILTHASQSNPVQFCLLDSNTRALCNAVVSWNQKVTHILCQAAALPNCPDAGFFYSPSMYALENQEFASDTVSNFYLALDSSKCVNNDFEAD